MSTASGKSPFTLRVGQMMTGFGAGCGIGVGVGYPIALGSIPVLGDALSATSSAGSRAFGGVGHKAFGMLKKLGIKNLQAGVGCGVGIGHGFGVGLALKPGVSQQIAHILQEKLSAVGSKLRKHMPATEEDILASESEVQPVSPPGIDGGKISSVTKLVDEGPGKPMDYSQSNATSPLKTEALTSTSQGAIGEVEDLRRENEILRTLLRHQELIEGLRGENAALRQVLFEEFNVNVDKNSDTMVSRRVGSNSNYGHIHSYGQNCFDCRRSARRRR